MLLGIIAQGQPAEQPMTFWLLMAGLMMIGLAILVIFISRLAIHRINMERDLKRQAELEHQKELLRSNIRVQERERQRIAADLHDELSSRLNVLRLSLYDTATDLTDHLPLLDDAITISRELAHDLYPPLLAEFGIVETLRDFVRPLKDKPTAMFNDLSHTHDAWMDPERELHLFRVAQELINNAIRHSQAEKIEIDIRMSDAFTVLRVGDDGIGFHPEQAQGGLGMHNLQSRVQELNGQFRISSHPGKGTVALLLIKNTKLANNPC